MTTFFNNDGSQRSNQSLTEENRSLELDGYKELADYLHLEKKGEKSSSNLYIFTHQQ